LILSTQGEKLVQTIDKRQGNPKLLFYRVFLGGRLSANSEANKFKTTPPQPQQNVE
jgi:hypothetical protein